MATLTVGLIIGLIYMWKVGLVGLGEYLSNEYFLLVLTTYNSMCPFPHVHWLHPSGMLPWFVRSSLEY